MSSLRGGLLLVVLGGVGCIRPATPPTPEVKLPNKELIEQPISQEMYYKIHPDKRPHVHVQVTLDLDADGQITIEGQSRTDEQVSQWLLEKPETERRETLVIIRAVKGTPTGAVQRVIKLCQSVKCEKFALRAKKPEE